MTDRIQLYREAGRKAARYLIAHQRENGAFIDDDFREDVYHKNCYSLSVAGFWSEAHRLATWVRENELRPSGELLHCYSPGRMQVYKDAWMLHGVHRLARFEISYPLMDWIATFQAPCGGFPCEGRGDPWVRSLTTSWCGVAALYMGRLDVAHRAGNCLLQMLEQQPDEGKFYYMMTLDGKLGVPGVHPDGPCIDAAQTDQCYWEAGIALICLGRLYQATGVAKYLDAATRVFEFKLRCRDDAFAHGNSGKNGLGAAIYYDITGDERAREAACRLADFLVETQEDEGGWRYPAEADTLVTRLDHAAEYNVWLQEIASVLAAKAGG